MKPDNIPPPEDCCGAFCGALPYGEEDGAGLLVVVEEARDGWLVVGRTGARFMEGAGRLRDRGIADCFFLLFLSVLFVVCV